MAFGFEDDVDAGAGQHPLCALEELRQFGAHSRRVEAIRGAQFEIPEFGIGETGRPGARATTTRAHQVVSFFLNLEFIISSLPLP